MKKRWMSILLVVIMAGSALTLASCSAGGEAQGSAGNAGASPSVSGSEAAVDTGAAEPQGSYLDTLKQFSATDFEGNTVTQDIFSDYDLTMVNIWATFCGPCIEEMPELGQLKKEYADKGVNVVGIVVDITDADGNVMSDGLTLAKDIVSQTGADYTHIIPSQDLGVLVRGITVVPTTVFVDSQGNVVGEEYLGALDLENWSRVIDYLLEQS